MPRSITEKILLIGDSRDEIRAALADAMPDALITSVGSVFAGIAELADESNAAGFTTVLTAAEPIERRPEAAVQTLRELAGNSRLLLFGHPTLELLSRKMLEFGCDDYLVMPAQPAEIRQMLSAPNPRLVSVTAHAEVSAGAVLVDFEQGNAEIAASLLTAAGELDVMAVGNVLLDALLRQPHDPVGWTLRLASSRLAPAIELLYRPTGAPPPVVGDDHALVSQPLTSADGSGGTLFALVTFDIETNPVHDLLRRLAVPVAKVVALQARHVALQKMAITDELTGVYNSRYFHHFLQRILEKARLMHFPVTLLLFDIDDFKTYNDQFGHQVGDEILKQTAAMMKRCTREHDLVARIGGDEFAVVFWDKEGPRQPREPRSGNVSRPPQSPVQIFERFKRMIRSDQFTAIGPHGQGMLGISAGLAVYPYEGNDVKSLIAEADKALMQGAKKQGGKNCLFLVGGNGNGGSH